VLRKRACVVREGAERKGPVTGPRSPPTSPHGDGILIVVREETKKIPLTKEQPSKEGQSVFRYNAQERY
jgi:hypothetical protein